MLDNAPQMDAPLEGEERADIQKLVCSVEWERSMLPYLRRWRAIQTEKTARVEIDDRERLISAVEARTILKMSTLKDRLPKQKAATA